MTQKTAVEWLESELKNSNGLPYKHFEEIINQAKEMEKEQIIDAYHINPLESKWKNIGINYYNETFKK